MNEYDLARRIKNKPVFVPELAQVVGVNPLVIQVGNAEYAADKWLLYEPWYECEDVALEGCDITGKDSEGGALRINKQAEVGHVVLEMTYQVGDLLTVQQLPGGKGFVILSKARRVM